MKLFFFDYDGTLHHRQSTGMSARTVRALQALRNAGHKIILCTGRCYGHLPKEAQALPFDCYATACGAATFIDGKPAWERRMDTALVLQSMELFWQLHLDGAVEGQKRILFYQMTSSEPEEVPEVHTFEEYAARFSHMPVHKLTLFQVPMPREAEAFLTSHSLQIINNSNVYYEVIQQGQHKGQAVLDIAAHYHVPLSDTYCFGDSMNDAEMLRAVGHGIVVGNAPLEVQRIAHEVTAPVEEDGVALWIERFLKTAH